MGIKTASVNNSFEVGAVPTVAFVLLGCPTLSRESSVQMAMVFLMCADNVLKQKGNALTSYSGKIRKNYYLSVGFLREVMNRCVYITTVCANHQMFLIGLQLYL